MIRSTTLFLVLGLAASCGDNTDLYCEPGTFQHGDDCAAADPNDKTAPVTVATPAGLRARTLPGFVMLSSEEDGVTIHYTTDGSEPDASAPGELSPVVIPSLASGTTIKFFGVDPSGNVEETHTETYAADTVGPGPVTNLAVSPTGTVTWTNPTDADYKGTLLVRVNSLVDAEPVAPQIYTAPGSLSASMPILVSGAATSYADAPVATGYVRYLAWAYDDLGNYSMPTVLEGSVGSLNPAATFTYDTDTETLTLTDPPDGFDLTGTTADYAGNTVTLHLSIKNTTTSYFQNPKILVPDVTNAALSGADGQVASTSFKSLGPEWFAPGATRTVDIDFTGAAGSTMVTIQLSLGTNASLLAGWHRGYSSQPHRILDSGSNQARMDLAFSSPGRSNSLGGIARRGLVIGQHFYDVPTTHHSIERWDMVTRTKVGGVTLPSQERTNVMSLLHSAGGYEYAIVREGGYGNSGRISYVYRFDENLKRVGQLAINAWHGRGSSNAAISPDGKLLAIPANASIVLVDLATFTVKDMDPSTAWVDHISTSHELGDEIRDVTFLADSSGIVAIGRSAGASVIKLTETGYTETFTQRGGQGNAVARMPDGRIWIATGTELAIYTPSTNAITVSAYPTGVMAMTVLNGQLWVLQNDRRTVNRVDDTGAVVQTATLSANAYGHWLAATAP